MTNNKVHIKFGIPQHGWLLTTIAYNDFTLELDISNVPIDPMVQLCDALISINKGIKVPDRVIWHLEPYCYYLQFEKLEFEYKAVISESDSFGSPAKITTEFYGSFEEIILPFYRALKHFCSQPFKPSLWAEIDPERIKKLTELIRQKKKSRGSS